jgi:hypothetical protein
MSKLPPTPLDYAASRFPRRPLPPASKAACILASLAVALFLAAFPLFNELLLLSSLAVAAVGMVVAVIAVAVDQRRRSVLSLLVLLAFWAFIVYLKYVRH